MIKRPINAILLASVILMTGCSDTEATTKATDPQIGNEVVSTVDVQQNEIAALWAKDIDHLYKELKSTHKGLYDHVSETTLTAEFELLKNRADNLSLVEFKFELMRIVAMIGDSHTIYSGLQDLTETVLPLKFVTIEGSIYCVNATKEYEDLLFKEIVKFDDTPTDAVIYELEQLIPSENEYWDEYIATTWIRIPDISEALGLIDTKEQVTLTYLDGSDLKSVDVITEDFEQKSKIEYVIDGYVNNLVGTMDKIDKKNYSFEYDDENKIVIVHYDECWPEPDYTFDQFTEEVWSFIDNNDVDKLVIDLRYNTGGDSGLFDPFRKKLAKSKKLNQPDKSYVLIGNRTFSSGTDNAAVLRRLTNSTLIGEPTGGTPNGYGNSGPKVIIELPNVGGEVQCTNKYFEFDPGTGLQTVIPDVIIEKAIEDYVNSRDKCMEYVIDDLVVGTL